jgi:O-antigen/teichoic acid export membrane protein
MSFYAIAAVLFQSGMQNALLKYYLETEDYIRRKRIFSSIISLICVLGIIFTAFGVLCSLEISQIVIGTSKYSNLVELLFISLFLDTLGFFGLQLLKTQEKAKKVVLFSILSALVNLILNIIFVYCAKIGVEGIFWAQIISSICLLIFLLKDVFAEFIPVMDIYFIKKAFIFSLPIILGGLMSSSVDVCDRFFLNIYTDKNVVGIYSFSYKIAMVMNIFVISFRTAWIPYALNLYKRDNSPEAFGKTYVKLLSAGFFIILAVTFFAPAFFNMKLFGMYLISKSYEPGLIILPYVLTGYLLNGIIAFYSLYPFVSNRSYHFLISDGSAFVVNIILNFMLVPAMGMLGAAIATTSAFLISAAYLYIISRKRINIIYPLNNIAIITFVTFIAFAIGVITKSIYVDIALIIIYIFAVTKLAKIKLSGLLRIT